MPVATEVLTIAVAGIFIFGGVPVLIYTLIVLSLACLIRIKRLGKVLHWAIGIIYGLIIAFTINGISILWALLFHAGKSYFVLYILAICLSALLLLKFRPFNLRWYHGVLFSAVFILAASSAVLSQLRLSKGHELTKLPKGIEVVVDYEKIFKNEKKSITPRYLEFDPDEKTLFICNRVNAPNTRGSLLVHDMTSNATRIVDLRGMAAMGIKFDPFTDKLAVAAYNEAAPFVMKSERKSALFWVDRAGEVSNSVAMNQNMALYSIIYPTKDKVRIIFNNAQMTYDRRSGAVSKRYFIIAVSIGAGTTNFMELPDRLVLCMSGPLLNMLFIPGILLFDREMKTIINSHTLIDGGYVLGYDSKKEEIYTNAYWSGTLRVYDKNLNFLRKIKVGNVIRAIAIDSDRRTGYAVEYSSGDIIAFNLDTGRRHSLLSIGKGARALCISRTGDLFAGSMNGIFRIPPNVWTQPPKTMPNQIVK